MMLSQGFKSPKLLRKGSTPSNISSETVGREIVLARLIRMESVSLRRGESTLELTYDPSAWILQPAISLYHFSLSTE